MEEEEEEEAVVVEVEEVDLHQDRPHTIDHIATATHTECIITARGRASH